MDSFGLSTSSSNNNNNTNVHRNTWSNYPAECYSTSVDYYRQYGAPGKPILSIRILIR